MLAQALPTGQLWLCFPREENCTKIDPRRVQNRPAGGPDGSFARVGPNLAAKAARKPSLGGFGVALGTLLALLEPSWGLLGRSWGAPGRSWAPLGGRFGPSRGLIWTIWTMSVALREIQQKPCILPCFLASRASHKVRNRSNIGPGGLLDVSWHQRSVSKALVTSSNTQGPS